MESEHKKAGYRSVLGLSKKRWSHRLAKSQFSIFGIPRSVIMTIIGIKTNKIARQNSFLRKPYEGPFLSWFFLPRIIFVIFELNFQVFFSELNFITHLEFYMQCSAWTYCYDNNFKKFWLFPQGSVIAVFTYPTFLPLPLPLLFPLQPRPSIIPDIYPLPTPPSITLLLTQLSPPWNW